MTNMDLILPNAIENHMYDSPTRTPDWCWRRMRGYLYEGEPCPSKGRDSYNGFKWIKRAARFKEAMETTSDPWSLRALYPDIYWAHHMYVQEQLSNRWQLEAYLLARQPYEDIGDKMSMTPEAVDAYESLFFNVKDRIDASGYIVNTVMGIAVNRGVEAREHDLLLKIFGYFYGPHALEAVHYTVVDPHWCYTPAGAGMAVQEDSVASIKIKAAAAAKMVPVNSRTQMSLLDAFTKFVEVERTTESSGRGESLILDMIGQMFEQMPFTVGGRDPKRDHQRVINEPIHNIEKNGAMLRHEELLQVQAGNRLGYENEIEVLHYPVDETTSGAE